MKQLVRKALVVAVALFSVGWARASWALTLETLNTFDPNAGELPESITIDGAGNLYMSMSNMVKRRTPGGTITTFGTLPISGIFALGVKVGPDGCVYTVSTSLNPTIDGAFVWKICTPGSTAVQVAELDQGGHPNDLAFDDDCNLYVTDPFLGVVWKVLPNGTASIWLSDTLLQANFADPALVILPVGVDGIAFDETKRHLYLSNLDYGRIVRVRIRDNGDAGRLTVFAEDSRLRGADGIAFDERHNLYVAVNTQDQLAEIDRDGAITVLATGSPLDGPSSFVFGVSPGDRRTLYITSSAFGRAFGIFPGTPMPALLSAEVPFRGLPLP
jgi:sugar lactone lactonase YvrE